MSNTTERTPGVATNGEIANIIDELAPILDPHPTDHKLIALGAAILIVLNPDMELDELKDGVDILITTASKYVAQYMDANIDWDDVPAEKMN